MPGQGQYVDILAPSALTTPLSQGVMIRYLDADVNHFFAVFGEVKGIFAYTSEMICNPCCLAYFTVYAVPPVASVR